MEFHVYSLDLAIETMQKLPIVLQRRMR
ncbi:protein of unknown function [Microbacterium sp. Nx66]|nr:protein of unknown function [Microbacterium sp. Nx66]